MVIDTAKLLIFQGANPIYVWEVSEIIFIIRNSCDKTRRALFNDAFFCIMKEKTHKYGVFEGTWKSVF